MKYVLILLVLLSISLTSASFISPISNQTYNHSNITLNYELNETPADFYYIKSNNTDGTERLYPTENHSVEFEAVEGKNIIIAFYIINETEFYDLITFYVNTTIINETEEIITPPVIIPSSGGGGGGTCVTKWDCSEWSECYSGNYQIRTCSYKTNHCKPRSVKPNETQSCVYIKPVEEEPEEVNPVVDEIVSVEPEKDYRMWYLAGAVLIGVVLYFIFRRKDE